jgi:hypothetical protein
MPLDKKTAIGYGAAGASGSALARAYAREGADMHRSATCLPACRLTGLTWRPHRSGWLPLAPGAGTPSVHKGVLR